jgi:hypothetical protein
MTDHHRDLSDDELGRRLAMDLPSYAAPTHVREAVLAALPARRRPAPWVWPAVTALATAAVLVLFFLPSLPRLLPGDPATRLVRAVVSEHTRTLMWGSRWGDVVPTVLPGLSQDTGVTLARALESDERLTLVAAEPVYVEQRRGVAMHYRDAEGHLVSYVAVPMANFTVPERYRIPVDRWRPGLVREGGFAAWLWRQGDVACVIVSDRVSDAEMETFKDYFRRLRLTTEALPAY